MQDNSHRQKLPIDIKMAMASYIHLAASISKRRQKKYQLEAKTNNKQKKQDSVTFG